MKLVLPVPVVAGWLLFLSAVAPAAVKEVPVARDAADSVVRVERALAAGDAYLRDLGQPERTTIFTGRLNAPRGRYRLHAPMAVHPLGDLVTSWLKITLQAGQGERTFNTLAFGQADDFTDLTLDFTSTGPKTPVTVVWALEGKGSTVAQAKATVAPKDMPLGLGEDAKDEAATLNALEDPDAAQPIGNARNMAAYVMLREAHVEPLSPVAVESIRVNKITYKRGEQGKVVVALRNAGAAAQTVSLAVEVQGGLDGKWPVKTETVTVPSGAALNWNGEFATEALSWGCALHVAATVQGYPPETGNAMFSVPDRLWDTAIMATCPAQMTKDFGSMEHAREAAAELKEKGFNGFEAYFWAPCDFLEYTPETERFFSGQTAYCQSVTGTRNIIAACHELGIFATFYANLWGGSGEPAFEVMRRHPEWFGSANFHSGALDDAPLMAAGVLRGPGHKVWSYNQLNDKAGMGLFDYHVDEILGTRKMFGWDGIRYDSYYSAPWTIKAMTHIRERLRKEAPEFVFGYNAFAGAEYNAGAMDSLADGMVMAEGLRVGPGTVLGNYARGLNEWRTVTWPYGAAVGPLYGFTAGQDKKKSRPPSSLDEVLLSSVVIAAGGHPYYNRMESSVGQHPAFALRYAEYLYNTKMREPLDPDGVVKFPKGIEPLAWKQLLRSVSLGNDRQRLVVHVLNVPEAYALGGLDMKALPPLRKVPVSVQLPSEAKVTGAWWLQAVPAAAHQVLPVVATNGVVSLILPEVRFYGAVVLEFTSKVPIAEKVDARTAWEARNKVGQAKP